MGKKEFNPSGRPCNFSAQQDQTPNNALLQCDAPHDPTELSYNPHVAENAALAFSEMVQRRNPEFNKLFARNSREYANQSSGSKHDWDETSMRAASGSKRSTDGDEDDSNKDFPSSMKQRSNMIIGDENPSGLGQNTGTIVKESDTDIDLDAQLKMEADEIRKERRRLSKRESAKRSKIRKQKECEDLCQKIDTLKDENFVLTQTLAELSEKCLELTNENDSIEEELVKEYGPELVADLLHMKPT